MEIDLFFILEKSLGIPLQQRVPPYYGNIMFYMVKL